MKGIKESNNLLRRITFIIFFLQFTFILSGTSFSKPDTSKWETLFTNLSGHPTSAVPGLMGTTFETGNFDRIFVSPNGNYVFSATTSLPAEEDEVIILNGNMVLREGTSAPWTMGENVGLIDTKLGINDAGTIVFATNTDGNTESDEYIVRRTSDGTFTTVAREANSASPPLASGTFWGFSLTNPVISSSGQMGFVAESLMGLPANTNEALILGNTVLAQKGVTVPPGQSGNEFIENFGLDDFWINEDGSKYMYTGDLTGSTSTEDVVVVDGSVVLQAGAIIAGSGFVSPIAANAITRIHMDPAGNWYARGSNVNLDDWIVRNGIVIAKLGDPITPGSSEVWDDTEYLPGFFLHVGNTLGEYVLGGVTDSATGENGVLVFYGLGGANVIAREGDPIDLDGNGLFDDDAFFDTFGNDDLGAGHLDDNGVFYIVATIQNAEGLTIGQGVFRMFCRTNAIFTSTNLIQFDDPCNCNNYVRVNNTFLFGDTLRATYDPGATITFVAAGSSDFYDENGLPIADGTPFTEVSSGIYELPFFKRDGVQPVVFVSINGEEIVQVDPSVLEVCNLSSCPTLIPTLGQWSLVCIMLLSLIFGILVLEHRKSNIQIKN